ncbi:hypothetical protein ABW20_dc0106730 [Dactylellina cionopaga]|nr:hypothetical protein ABW20_dc0106730 [Dactylellina cionopaga]
MSRIAEQSSPMGRPGLSPIRRDPFQTSPRTPTRTGNAIFNYGIDSYKQNFAARSTATTPLMYIGLFLPIIFTYKVSQTPSPLPHPYPAASPPYLSRVRINRFNALQPRKMGIYEKIHAEWIKKALMRQQKNLKWDPMTGEPLFEVKKL